MFAIKSARQWTNTDSLVRRGRCLDLINIHLLIFSCHSPAFSPLSPSSSSSVPVSSTSSYLLHPTHHPSPPLVVGAGQRNYFIRGRPLICPRVYFALVKRRRHTLYATPLPPLALYNRPLPALVCISLTLTLRPILFAVSSISTTRRGIGAVDAG